MKRRLALTAGLIAVCASVAATPASAAPTPVAIDSRTPSLDDGDDGRTVTLGFTNLTDQAITLEASPGVPDQSCELSLDKTTLPRAEHASAKVTVPSGCKVEDDAFGFDVVASAPGSTPASFPIVAESKEEDQAPNWTQLRVFLFAFLALALGGLLLFAYWYTSDPKNESPSLRLEYLKDTWSFKDSWVSNVTVAAALLTGIFGTSEVVKTFLGDQAESSLALATVGAAIGAAFVAAGPLLLFATTSGGKFTVGGLLAASVVTLTGAVGELWVVYAGGKEFDLDGLEDFLLPAFILAAILLLAYATRTLLDTIAAGTTDPEAAKKKKGRAGERSDTIKAAEMIVATLKPKPGVAAKKVETEVEEVLRAPAELERSALL